MEVNLIDNSRHFIEAKNEAVMKALEVVGLTAERHAKEQCPVDTGLLRNSITHAVGGQQVRGVYKAQYGENRYKSGKNAGKRYGAGSKNAGSVKFGKYNGTIGSAKDQTVYIGTNVEYAQAVETKDSSYHKSGKAHFLRDAVANHRDEYIRIAEKQLKKG